jgi:hypothetical protein
MGIFLQVDDFMDIITLILDFIVICFATWVVFIVLFKLFGYFVRVFNLKNKE